jgi:hypothetical protein
VLVADQYVEKQGKSGDKPQGDKNKTLYVHSTPQAKKIKEEILYQSLN